MFNLKLRWPFKRTAKPMATVSASASPPVRKRAFKGATIGRLTNDWITSPIDTNEDLRNNIRALYSRSEDLAKNNSYFRKYLALREKNIIGPDGIQLQMKVYDPERGMDSKANTEIERGWQDWSRPGNCSIDGRMSLLDVERLIHRSRGVYGEFFVRVHEGVESKYGFGLEVINPQLCDYECNQNIDGSLKGVPRIVMGVELGVSGVPVAYFFRDNVSSYGSRVRVPASEIIHGFKVEFPGQVRGIPPASSAIYSIHMFDGYNEAVLVNARASACKMGFLVPDVNAGEYIPDDVSGDTNINELEPGKVEKLPPGYKFESFNPSQPTQGYDVYSKGLLREIASGFDVAYSTLANDLENVNFSSIRAGVLDERDTWKAEQRETIEHFLEPVFQRWLPFFMLNSSWLPFSKLERFRASTWVPRAFQWVDPQADAQSRLLMLQNNLTTPQQIAAETGRDLEDIYSDIEEAEKMAVKHNIWKPVSQSKTTPQVDNGAPLKQGTNKK